MQDIQHTVHYAHKDQLYLSENGTFGSPRPGLDSTTQSPLLSMVTSAPTEVTTPTPSPPPTAGRGGVVPYTPRRVESYHHVPHVLKYTKQLI